MQMICKTSKHGDLAIELDVAPNLGGLVEQYGEEAVYYAATEGRSLADLVSAFVRGKVSGKSEATAEEIIAGAQQVTLENPLSKAAVKAQKLLEELASSGDSDLQAAIASLSEETKAAILARIVQ